MDLSLDIFRGYKEFVMKLEFFAFFFYICKHEKKLHHETSIIIFKSINAYNNYCLISVSSKYLFFTYSFHQILSLDIFNFSEISHFSVFCWGVEDLLNSNTKTVDGKMPHPLHSLNSSFLLKKLSIDAQPLKLRYKILAKLISSCILPPQLFLFHGIYI